MNTFLEKVTRSPKARSRIAAASFIREERSSNSRRSVSGDMTEDLVRRVLGGKVGEVGGRVDVSGEARPADDSRFNAGLASELGMAFRAGLVRGKCKADGRRRPQ